MLAAEILRTWVLVVLTIFAQVLLTEGKTEADVKNLRNKNSQQSAVINSLTNRLKKMEEKLNYISYVFASKVNSEKSCKDILATNKLATSGTYWIKPTPNKLLQVYCDMETQGGGWTLVYSYTFTNYKNFYTVSNAVTPRPNWPVSEANVPISTTPPLSESSRGAVDWNLWKNIGQEFMVKSNINDWIVCKPNGGSLVTNSWGSISCQNIKNVATACRGNTPNEISWLSDGPLLTRSLRFMYSFEGNTSEWWPMHNPCITGSLFTLTTYKKGVSNPGGQIFLR